MTPATFPEPIHQPIFRESLIEGLLFELEKNPIVVVNGPSNVGKTTLLAQFFERHKDRCIATFLNGSSNWAYDFEFITEDLCLQAQGICNTPRKQPTVEMEVPTGKWRTAAVALSKAASASEKPIYLILDGLDELPGTEESAAKAIFSLMPLGMRGLKFLISGTRASTYLCDRNAKKYGEFSVTGFTQEETVTYLQDILPRDEATKLYTLSKLPGYHAGVRRIFSSQGKLPDTPLPSLAKVFDYEWSKVKNEALVEELIAYLCFNKSTPTRKGAANFLSVPIENIDALLRQTSFLESRQEEIHFKHDSILQFLRNKVTHLQKRTVDRLIDGFLGDEKSEESVNQLPELFSQAGRYEELIAYLDDHYILTAIRNRKAARFVQEKAVIGLKAAAKNESTEHIIRFGLQGANLDELYFDDHWASRIQAFISLDELTPAFEIARSFSLPEDRLQALSRIANDQKERKGRVEEALLEEIKREHSLLDKEHLGHRAYDIAADLVHIQPKLALELIRVKATTASAATELERKQDSVSPEIIESSEESAYSAIEILQNRIEDPALRSLSRVLYSSSRGKTGDEILAEVEKMGNDEEKEHFLRLWLGENRQHGGRERVVRYAIRFGISSKNVSPTPSFFLDAVRAMAGLESAKELIEQVKSVTPLLKRMGPTVDYYYLMLRIVELEAQGSNDAALASYIRLCVEIDAMEDPAVRAVLHAEQMLMLFRVKEVNATFFNKQHFQEAQGKLENAIKEVLGRTADHYQALRTCIRKTSRFDCVYAHGIIERMNTEARRNRGFADVVFHSIVNRTKACDVAVIEPSYLAISDPDVRSRCLLAVLRQLAFGAKKNLGVFNLQRLHGWCQKLDDPKACSIALAYYLVSLVVVDSKKLDELDWLKAEVSKRSSSIEDSIAKIDTLHSLTFIFAQHDKTSARKYLDAAERLRSCLFIKTGGVEQCLFLNLKVSLRSFSGLIKKKAYTPIDLEELVALIAKIPSVRPKALLYAELAIRFYLGNDTVNCRKVVSENLSPLTGNIPPESHDLKRELAVVCAPAMYGASAVACLASIEELSPHIRSDAVNSIIGMLISKRCPGDPQEGTLKLDDKTTANDIVEILKLLEYLNDDGIICYYIKVIAQFLSQNHPRVTKGEREELLSKIGSLISAKLPSTHFTSHEGYRLLGDSYVLGLRGAKEPEWHAIVERARKIPNVSDRVLILASFADVMGGKLLPYRRGLLKEALREMEKIPVVYDRGERALLIAEVAKTLDREIFNAAIQGTIGKSTANDTDDRNMELRRRAVDILYYEDEKLANQLVSALDDEPLREVKAMLTKRIEFLSLQSKINKKELGGIDLCSAPDVPAIFWRNLKRLNGGLIEAPKFRSLVPLFAAIEGRRIEDVYPILCFGIESCVRNYEGTDEAFGLLTRIYRVCLSSARLVIHCLSESKENTLSVSRFIKPVDSANSIVVSHGEKDIACEFIRSRLAGETADKVYIVDPYFTARDLDLLELIRSQLGTTPIYIMTGKKKIQGEYGNDGAAAAFRSAWKERYGEREAGDVKIFVVGKKSSGEPPIHDRFVVLDKVGVKIGGSWNGVGGDKQMDMSALNAIETAQWRRQAESYMLYMHSHEDGAPLSYDIFSL